MLAYTDKLLFQAFQELDVVDKKQLEDLFTESLDRRIPLDELLLEKDLVTDENLGRIMSELFNLPLVNLTEVTIPKEVLTLIPEIVARKQKMIAFKKDEKGLHVAMADPTNIQMKDFIEKKTGLMVHVYYATKRSITGTLNLYKKDIKQAFDEIISQNIEQAKHAKNVDPPIIKIMNTVLSYAYQNKSSDVHIEPTSDTTLVRFRVDGILHDIISLPRDFHPRIVTRIKVLSSLRSDEHQAAQDGKFQFETEGDTLDIRVSIVPIREGEKIVMRILSEKSRQFSLLDLGFSEKDLEKTRGAYTKPYGMILSTGPTGAGKTTTLYAVLKLLNRRDVNIMTIEDPVEYEIDGVNQIQVNTKTNLTFAEGLRSIVRQDPDIILVGEIRDAETADIAVNSALTGHLVLSTLHTNDAATAIPRLLDMNIEPFLVASTVNIIIAQRLVRQIHELCRVSQEITVEEAEKYLNDESIKYLFGGRKTLRLYKGKGCDLDHNTGYEGRLGIFEVLTVDDQVRQAILERRDAGSIRKIAVKNGMRIMLQDGLEKVKEGKTTIDEVLRVTRE